MSHTTVTFMRPETVEAERIAAVMRNQPSSSVYTNCSGQTHGYYIASAYNWVPREASLNQRISRDKGV